SWWSEREERRFEREIREDMLIEFESNVRILDKDIASNEEYRKSSAKLTGLSDEELLSIPDDVLTQQFGSAIFVSAGFDPELGSVQALVRSGSLGVVGDRDLRLRLSRWEGLVEQCRRKNAMAVQFDASLTPVIVRSGADLHWSEIERRQLRALLDNVLHYFDVRVRCQHELRDEAQGLLAYLQDSN
ncbi:hypothetical protein, partial [Marinobacter alexandrii]|uniref:hypothetical protein n=1 Tax=Marinobacter alexandrii TaxID=2570351 RepID=UPI0032984BE3